MSTAAERIAARAKSGGRTAADRLASKYEHPTGGARGETFLATQAPKVKPTGVWTPIQAGFNYLSRPAYAIGNLAAGDPAEAGKNLLNLVPGTSAIPGLGGKPVYLSDALRQRGLLKHNLAGSVAGFILDVGTDPTTWLTAGTGTAASTAAKTAARQAGKEIAVIGARATPQQIANIISRAARAAENAPSRLTVGVRVPFSRSRAVELAGSERIPAFLGRQVDRLPEGMRGAGQATRSFFGESRGMNKAMESIYQAVRSNSEVWSREFARSNRVLNQNLLDLDKQLMKEVPGWSRGDAAKAISFHMDDPVKHPLPHPLLEEPTSRARAMRDQLNEMEIAAGIEKGQVVDYVPYLVAKAKDKDALKQIFGDNLGVADNPFFVKRRAVPSLEDFVALGAKHGFEPELNITKLLERRARASFKAQSKKAIDDAVAANWGLKPPPTAMPDVAGVKTELQREEARLQFLSRRKDTGQVQAVARNNRKRLTQARQRLRAAERTGDPVAVRNARAEVARLTQQQQRLQSLPNVGARPPAEATLDELVARLAEARRRLREYQGSEKGRGPLEREARDAALALRRARRGKPDIVDPGSPGENVAAAIGGLAKFEADVRRTGKAVERGKLRLKKAQKQKSAPVIKEAKAALRRAEAAERRATIALNVARAQFEGNPVAIRAQTKRVVKAKAKLTKVEREAGAIAAANKKLAERPGNFAPTREAYEEAKATWQEVASATKYHDGTLLPPETARSLAAVHKAIAATVKDEDGLAAVGTFMAHLGARWKALALLSPGYHIRNQIDDGFRAWVAGARSPLTYGQAAEIVPKPVFRAGKADEVIEAGGKFYKMGKAGPMTRKELLDQAESLGVINTGFVPSEIGSSMDAVRRAKIQGPGRGPLVRGSAELGAYRENVMRMFLFMELLKRGDDAVTAARITREALFDYGHVSRFVEVARRFWLPFITFPSKAIPWTLRTAATRPGVLATVAKAMNASNAASGNPDLSQLPPWLRSGFAVPIPDSIRQPAAGLLGPSDQPLIFNPERVSAWSSLNLLDPRPKQAMSNVVGGLVNPLATTPVEIATGFDFFFGNQSSPRAKQGPLIRWLEENTGIIPNVDPKTDVYTGEKVPAFPSWMDKLLGLAPVYGQANQAIPNTASETPRLGTLKYFTGIPITPFDRARAAFFAEKYGNK